MFRALPPPVSFGRFLLTRLDSPSSFAVVGRHVVETQDSLISKVGFFGLEGRSGGNEGSQLRRVSDVFRGVTCNTHTYLL